METAEHIKINVLNSKLERDTVQADCCLREFFQPVF